MRSLVEWLPWARERLAAGISSGSLEAAVEEVRAGLPRLSSVYLAQFGAARGEDLSAANILRLASFDPGLLAKEGIQVATKRVSLSEQVDAVKARLERWNTERQAAQASRVFSAEEKDRQVKALRKAALSALEGMLSEFWESARKAERDWSSRVAQTAAAFENTFDPARLAYAASRIPTLLLPVKTADDLKAAYRDVCDAGERHLMRAFREVAPAIIAERFGNTPFVLEAQRLIHKLEEDADEGKGVATVEGEAKAAELVAAIVAGYDLTAEVAASFGLRTAGFLVGPHDNAFALMLSKVAIDKTTGRTSRGQELQTTVRFLDEPPADKLPGVKLPEGVDGKRPLDSGWMNRKLS
jgi:hypothetical protein